VSHGSTPAVVARINVRRADELPRFGDRVTKVDDLIRAVADDLRGPGCMRTHISATGQPEIFAAAAIYQNLHPIGATHR
jgi:hypothetical protein